MSDDVRLPDGFKHLVTIKKRLGELMLAEREEPACLLVTARGYIGASLLVEELNQTKEFGERHPEGWDYIADTLLVRALNPVNPVYLRRIPQLPNIKRYVVVGPLVIRTLAPLARMIVRPFAFVKTVDEALVLLGS